MLISQHCLQEGEGILQRAMQALLGKDENHQPSQDMGTEGSRSLKISMMEVYNEAIFDLLGPTRVSLETKPATDGGRIMMVNRNICGRNICSYLDEQICLYLFI